MWKICALWKFHCLWRHVTHELKKAYNSSEVVTINYMKYFQWNSICSICYMIELWSYILQDINGKATENRHFDCLQPMWRPTNFVQAFQSEKHDLLSASKFKDTEEQQYVFVSKNLNEDYCADILFMANTHFRYSECAGLLIQSINNDNLFNSVSVAYFLVSYKSYQVNVFIFNCFEYFNVTLWAYCILCLLL